VVTDPFSFTKLPENFLILAQLVTLEAEELEKLSGAPEL
jgi:hypothetical protein